MDIVDFFFCRERTIPTIHRCKPLYRNLSGYRQVAVHLQQRVELRTKDIISLRDIIIINSLQRHHTRRLTIASLRIVIVGRMIVAQLHTHDAQQVVAEDLAV